MKALLENFEIVTHLQGFEMKAVLRAVIKTLEKFA
jgi:hypothetical protein